MSGSDVQRTAPETAALAGRSFSAGRALRHAAKVLPEHARAHNRSLVLQTLFHQGAMSRADLSRETGLTRVTISDLVAELIDDGYVAERGLREVTGPGKPAILVDLDREGHRIVGLDLSGTDRFLGAVLTGLFADAAVNPAGKDGSMAKQFLGAGLTVVYTAIVTAIILYIIKAVMGLRPSKQAEVEGLDISLHGEAVQ